MKSNTRDLFSTMKSLNFDYSKDVFGFYFSKGIHKFSCIKSGDKYLCYHNKFIDKQWALQSKTNQILDLENSLLWVIRIAQSTGL